MKLIAQKLLYIDGDVVTEGAVFVTSEQHGRELLAKSYVRLLESEHTDTPEQRMQIRKNKKVRNNA
ncbi:hypothetical protein [Escherichia coli]|uniref:hypothetical protein n=1 Tax=Escherichia coli TaxID=562 RepID=UPI000BDEFFE6|nr:hypothetical protein [Escherichia coli]MBB6931885.1 hypothetical protein [Escherichia coli]